jgi:hypothetical protein
MTARLDTFRHSVAVFGAVFLTAAFVAASFSQLPVVA